MPIISANQQQPSNEPESTMPEGRRQKGTGFTNIGRILGANIGAGEQMGQQVGSSLGLQAGQVKAGAERSAQQFRTQAEEARAKALQDISGVGQYLGAPVTGVSELTEEQAKTAGEKLRGAKYAGPTQMTGAESLGKKAGTLGQAAIYGYGGPGGQRQLLRQSVAAPGTYTAGQSVLDQILLGQSAAGQKAVRGGAQEALGTKQAVGGLLGTTAQTAKDISSEVGKEKERVSKGALEELSGIQEEATRQGEIFATETRRANELLSDPSLFGMRMDPTLGRVYDPVKAEEDKRIMTSLGERGLGTGVIVDPTQKDYLTTVLQGLATGEVNINAPYFKGADQQAARNLALITGQSDLAKTIGEGTPFKTAVFTGAEDIKKGQTYQDMMRAVPEELQKVSTTIPEALRLLNYARYLEGAPPLRSGGFGLLGSEYQTTGGAEPTPMSVEEMTSMFKNLTGQSSIYDTKQYGMNYAKNIINKLTPILEELQTREQQLQRNLSGRMALQDYLNQMFGTVYSSDPTRGIAAGDIPQRTGPRQV